VNRSSMTGFQRAAGWCKAAQIPSELAWEPLVRDVVPAGHTVTMPRGSPFWRDQL